MLALQDHFSECASCEAERRSIRQVKMLLRSLHEPRPRLDLPGTISVRLAEAEQPLWHTLSSSIAPSWPPRPQRGRRLATALALSCLTVFSFAAACFAPAPRAETLASSGFLLSAGLTSAQPMPVTDTGPALLTAVPQSDFLSVADADALRRQHLFSGQYEAPVQTEMRLPPLPYETSSGYSPGEAAFAAYRTH